MYYTENVLPTANIAVRRNKVKTYSGNVYLQNKQEFEIELFNPTDETKLAKISMNGKSISSAGIVIKPGQRIYLERFLDSPKKFQYETYKVDGSEEAAKAIVNNGNVRIDFYNEIKQQQPIPWYPSGTTTIQYFSSPNVPFFTTTSAGTGKGTYTSGLTRNITSNNSLSSATMDSLSNEKETGRVEQGGQSNQTFTNYNGSFYTFPSTTISIKILPVSEQPFQAKDLATYCHQCGTKNKKGNYKFCPSCGTKY